MSEEDKSQELNEKEIIQNNNSSNKITTENKTLKSVQDKLNNFMGTSNNFPIKVQSESKKIKKNEQNYDFSCSIDEVRTNWRGVEKEDRRRCYVKVLEDRLILDKTGIMIRSDLGTRTIYFSDISSIDFDKSGMFHVTNSVKLIMRGGEFITLIHVGPKDYDLINNKWKLYKENQHNTKNLNSNSSQNTADDLLKYAELYEKGLLTDDEFKSFKQKLLNDSIESSSKFCGNCGAEISEDSKFCMNCGTKIN